MREFRRLVQMFYRGISESAGCVYFSAIPFMPVCELHRQYKHHGTGAFTVRSGHLQGWPAEVCTKYMDFPCTVAWSPDGKHICAGLEEGKILLLGATTGDVKISLIGHAYIITSVAFSHDSQHIASGSDDCTV
jgi:WD40 repeat protein